MTHLAPTGFYVCQVCKRDDVALIAGRCGRCLYEKRTPGVEYVVWQEEGRPPMDDPTIVDQWLTVLKVGILIGATVAIVLVELMKAVWP